MSASDPTAAPVGGAARPRARADQLRLAPLRERDLDGVEVPRHDGVREELPRLLDDLVAEVARREVHEREQPHVGLPCDERGLAGGRVQRLPRALALVGEERRLVDEHVRAPGRLDDRGRGRRVPAEHELATGPRRAEHLLRRHDRTVGERHRLSALEPPALRPVRDAELVRDLHVEAARPLVLDERVAERRHAVVDRERLERVAAPLEPRARVELDRLHRVRQPAEDCGGAPRRSRRPTGP